MVQPRVRRSTDTLPRKSATADQVLAGVPRQRPTAEPDLPKASDPASDEPRGVLHRLWRIVSGLLLIALAVASVTAMVTVMSQHLGFAPVLSQSMEPAFHPGDLVVTKPEPAADVRVGQVIALPVPDAPGQRYVHRVISVTMKDGKPVVRTKGDANRAPESFSLRIDSPTVPRVVATVPQVGRLSVLLQGTKTRLAVMAVTIIAILIAAWRMFVGPPQQKGKHHA
jgi:signal peptidase I